MTDAEIIKALECCSHEAYDCDVCPLNLKEEELCFIEVRKYALDLINHQKAEIERLKKGWKADVIETQNIKAEAIKEFAERVKQEINFPLSVWKVFDTLVKEMVGDAE